MLVEKVEKENTNIAFVYTTCHDWEEARSIGLLAIERKLACCSDFWEINSVYPWEGVIQEVDQYMLMLTTERRLSKELIEFIGSVHSYTTPMIAELDTALMNSSYKFWVDLTLRSKEKYISDEEGIRKTKDKDQEEAGYHFGKLK
jgi:periplasmic divalent cation tolerance protein